MRFVIFFPTSHRQFKSIRMKKTLSILLLLIPFYIFSQNDQVREQSSKYKLGVNIGTVWEVDDVRWESGRGWGVRFHRILNPYIDAPLHFSLGVRYLKGESIGIDWQVDSALSNNLTLNGVYEPKLDYNNSIGYVYQNHFTEFKEWAFEGEIGFNKLKINHNIDLYLFGGLGISSYYSYTNQLNSSRDQYTYNDIISTEKKAVLQQLEALRDNSYESPSFGSSGHEVVFTPSVGIGLGYMLTKNISIGFEHKISFPNTDLFDGRQEWNNQNILIGDNDIYHYSSLGINLWLGKAKKEKRKTSPKPYKATENSKPTITINQPNKDPYYSQNCEADIIATITGIESKSNIRVYKNGTPIPANQYDYFETTKKLYLKQNLDGNSKFRVFAYNSFGNTAKELEIKCEAVAERPSVNIITPSQNYTTAENCQAYIVATTTNISSKNQIEVKANGKILSPADYTFSALSQEITLNRKMDENTLFIIRVANDFAQASDQLTINCGPQGTPPEIVITNSNTKAVNSTSCGASIEARIGNMESKYGITVRENGIKISSSYFSFDPRTKSFVFNKNFSEQSLFSITAQNEYGYDSKEIKLICQTVREEEKKPQVIITKPLSNPHRTEEFLADITATILNVPGKSSISITENGQIISSSFYKYDQTNKRLTLSKAISDQSIFIITATNSVGSASDQITIIGYSEVIIPEILILSPNTNPYNTKECSGNLIATINNISSKSQIVLIENGRAVSSSLFNYQPANQRFSYSYLVNGKSELVIKATNEAGGVTKGVSINCLKGVTPPPPSTKKPEITIISPSTSPFFATDCLANIKAKVYNISSTSQLKVYENESLLSTSYFNFNAQSGELHINRQISKISVFKIIATNKAGSASKSTTIDCKQLVKPEITIISPTSNPYVANNCIAEIKANISNMSVSDKLLVYENARLLTPSNYSFNAINGLFTISKSISATSTFKISASNKAGSATVNRTIECKPKPTPKITIISPKTSPSIVTNCNISIQAKIDNIRSKSQIIVLENGKQLTSNFYSWNSTTSILTLNKKIEGKSNFQIKATNSVGSNSNEVEIKCLQAVMPPSVKIISPTRNPFLTVDCEVEIIALTTQIKSSSQLKVTENGKIISAESYDYNPTTQTLKLRKSILSESKFVITATNEGLSSSDNVTIKCQKPILKPKVNIKIPATNPVTITSDKLNVTATVLNISSKSQITVLLNGKEISSSSYTFTAFTKELKLRLNISRNSTLIIKATNKAGSANDQLSIIYDVVKNPPIITIISPTANPYNSSNCVADITAKIENINGLENITILENGKPLESDFYTWNAGNKQLRIQQDVQSISNFKITATNKDGSDSKTVTIKCARP